MLYWKDGLLFNNFKISTIPKKMHCDWSADSLTGLGAQAMGKMRGSARQKDRLSVWALGSCIYVPRLKAQTLRLAVRWADDFALDSFGPFRIKAKGT